MTLESSASHFKKGFLKFTNVFWWTFLLCNPGSGNDLLPDGTRPLHEPISTLQIMTIWLAKANYMVSYINVNSLLQWNSDLFFGLISAIASISKAIFIPYTQQLKAIISNATERSLHLKQKLWCWLLDVFIEKKQITLSKQPHHTSILH